MDKAIIALRCPASALLLLRPPPQLPPSATPSADPAPPTPSACLRTSLRPCCPDGRKRMTYQQFDLLGCAPVGRAWVSRVDGRFALPRRGVHPRFAPVDQPHLRAAHRRALRVRTRCERNRGQTTAGVWACVSRRACPLHLARARSLLCPRCLAPARPGPSATLHRLAVTDARAVNMHMKAFWSSLHVYR